MRKKVGSAKESSAQIKRNMKLFAKGVRRLKKLERELDNLDTRGFSYDEKKIRAKLKNVGDVLLVEREIKALKRKIDDRDSLKMQKKSKVTKKMREFNDKLKGVGNILDKGHGTKLKLHANEKLKKAVVCRHQEKSDALEAKRKCVKKKSREVGGAKLKKAEKERGTRRTGKKLRVGVFSFACGGGCSVSIVDALSEKFFEWNGRVEFVNFRALDRVGKIRDMDVAFVEGAIGAEKDVLRLGEIRAYAKRLIVVGNDAISGWASNVRNDFVGKKKWKVLALAKKLEQLEKVVPVSSVVKVDGKIGGDPISKEDFIETMEELLVKFRIKKKSNEYRDKNGKR